MYTVDMFMCVQHVSNRKYVTDELVLEVKGHLK
jgi:hypothetical protein